MRQLFSPFPDAWSAAGLILLRLMLGSTLIANAIANLPGPQWSQSLPAVIDIMTGTLVIIGLWTPIAGIVACLSQFLPMVLADQMSELQLLRAAVGLSLAFLGPGAWSVDARLFGRRRVEIRNLRGE